MDLTFRLPQRPAPVAILPRTLQTTLVCLLMAAVCAGCATTTYQAPKPTREEVQSARAEVRSIEPERKPLTVAEARALVAPIFSTIAEDAVKICRTVSEADSCQVPDLEIVDADTVNARAGYNLRNDPEIRITRGLVEQLADHPDGLALVIGHEYGHLITAHVDADRPAEGPSTTATLLSTALTVLAAASQATSSSDSMVIYRRQPLPTYSAREIDEYLRSTADPNGDYDWFSKAQEIEADYIGTYLATRSGFTPDGSALLEIGALAQRDALTPTEKQDDRLAFAYWDTHPHSAERAAHIRETLEEIEALKAKGYARPLPPRLILDIQDNNAAFHSLEELIAPAR